jgi:hypothetical protein
VTEKGVLHVNKGALPLFCMRYTLTLSHWLHSWHMDDDSPLPYLLFAGLVIIAAIVAMYGYTSFFL